MNKVIADLVSEEAAKRIDEDPSTCPIRIMAAAIFDLDLSIDTVQVDDHGCKFEPACPPLFKRKVEVV